MRKKGSGRPRTPKLAIGAQLLQCRVLSYADRVRADGYVREGYILECNCGRRYTATKTYISRYPDAACRSCGSRAGASERPAPKQSTHPLYPVWRAMHDRCKNPQHAAYKNYGARGIKVCKRWQKLDNFIADMGERPAGMSLERRNNDRGYSLANCYWATAKQQNNNTRANKWFTVDGTRRTLTEWAAILGTHRAVLHSRIYKAHWSVKDACTTPVGSKGRRVGTKIVNGKCTFIKEHSCGI